MSDFIRRDAVIDALLLEFPQINIPIVQIALERVSAVDAVKVVRCDKCARGVALSHSDNVVCAGRKMPKNGFCSYGLERREDNAVD